MNFQKFILVSISLAIAASAMAGDETDLAKTSQNPVGNIISLPFENNYYTDVGPTEKTVNSMVLKPVIPVNLGKYNLINRLIVPVTYIEGQDSATVPEDAPIIGPIQVFPGTDDEFGLGNIQYQAWISPANPGKLIWGFGPVVELPTNSDDALGSDTWSAGPSLLLLTMPGDWVVGAIVQQMWDVARSSGDDPEVSRFTLQPIINYNLEKGWYLTSKPVITADWEQEGTDKWSIPVGGGVGRMVKFGKQPVDFSLTAYKYSKNPDFGPNWDIQLTVKFLFPQ